MTTSSEDLATRVERLEHLFEEREMTRPNPAEGDGAHRFWARIPFSAWLKISGPTFAAMALGFAALAGYWYAALPADHPRRLLMLVLRRWSCKSRF